MSLERRERREPYSAWSPADFDKHVLGFSLARAGDDELRITLTANLVATNARALKPAVLDTILQGARAITVDLTHCRYVDGHGLGVLVSIANAARRAGGSFAVEHASSEMLTLFELTGIDGLFEVRT